MNTNFYWNILGGWDANKMNTLETPESYVVYLKAVGVKKENLTMSISDGILEIKSEDSKDEKDKVYTRREFYPDVLNLNLQLPSSVDLENIDAILEDGILQGTIPKKNKDTHVIQIR